MMSIFDERASQWESKGRRVELARDVVNSIIKYAEPEKDIDIADFGTGTGLILLGLADYAKTMTGYDTSRGMIDVLNRKAEEAGLTNLTTEFLDIEKDTFPENAFDLLTCSMVLHHVDRPEDFFSKAYRSLRTGGKLCVADLELTDVPFHDVAHEGVKNEGFSENWLIETMKKYGFSSVKVVQGAVMEKERNGEKINFPVLLAIGTK
ncbi:class I SAM-dependent methyltransferase [Denitrovibrio acetiphilus]|nr:class I SAM-dependent methyltransferase [Denitrovibrio acetiphilus]